MYKYISPIIAALLLAACSAPIPPTQFKGPEGNRAFAVSCGSMVSCYKEASALCPYSYKIIGLTTEYAHFPHGQSTIEMTHSVIAIECTER